MKPHSVSLITKMKTLRNEWTTASLWLREATKNWGTFRKKTTITSIFGWSLRQKSAASELDMRHFRCRLQERLQFWKERSFKGTVCTSLQQPPSREEFLNVSCLLVPDLRSSLFSAFARRHSRGPNWNSIWGKRQKRANTHRCASSQWNVKDGAWCILASSGRRGIWEASCVSQDTWHPRPAHHWATWACRSLHSWTTEKNSGNQFHSRIWEQYWSQPSLAASQWEECLTLWKCKKNDKR